MVRKVSFANVPEITEEYIPKINNKYGMNVSCPVSSYLMQNSKCHTMGGALGGDPIQAFWGTERSSGYNETTGKRQGQGT